MQAPVRLKLPEATSNAKLNGRTMVEEKLSELGLQLPTPTIPAANYVPYTLAVNALYISGQLPMGQAGIAHVGQVGAEVELEDAQAAAELCALNILAQVKAALGGFDRVVQCLKLGGFVNAAPGFTEHPAVINGASDLIVYALGERGKHARFAIGCSSLPLNAAVEVDALFHID